MTKIGIEKCMISMIWSISGIHSLLALTERMKYKSNSQYFCQHVISDIQRNIWSSGRRKTLKDLFLRLDIAPSHNSPPFSEKIESANAQRAPHPRDSPASVPNGFFCFRSLKEKFRGTSFTKGDDLIFVVRQIFSDIPEMALKNVFTNWITRLSWRTKKDGEYYSK
jgi:hypothetical protein